MTPSDQPSPLDAAAAEQTSAPLQDRVRPPLRRRTPRQPQSFWARMPVTVRYGGPLVIAGIIAAAILDDPPVRQVRLQLQPEGPLALAPESELSLEFFEYRVGARDLWPPRPLLQRQARTGATVEFLPDGLPRQSWVRVTGDGVGTTTLLCEAGMSPKKLRLHGPGILQDRVLDAQGRGVAGARVIATGWIPRGVPVAEAVTAADGTFQLTGLDTEVPSLGLRVLAPGFAVLNRDWSVGALEQKPLVLERTVPFRGRVALPEGVDPEGVHVYVARVPGLSSTLQPDGSFEMDHVPPPPTRLRPLIAGLPADWTLRDVSFPAGTADVVLKPERGYQLRGQIVRAGTRQFLRGATIHHRHGAKGLTIGSSDATGMFVLEGLPAGVVDVHATWTEPMRTTAQGGRGVPERWSGVMRIQVPEQLGQLLRMELAPPE